MFKWIFGLLVGCCSLVLMPSVPPTAILVGSVIASIIMLYVVRHIKQSLLRSCALIVSGCLFGFGWSLFHASWRLSQQVPSPANNSVHIIEAEVDSLPVIYPEYCQLNVKVTAEDQNLLSQKTLLLKDYSGECVYQLGDLWLLTVKLKPISGPVNLAGFDYEFYFFQQGMDGKGYIKHAQLLRKASYFSLDSLRQYLYSSLDSLEHSGLLQALIIGEKSNIPQNDKELLRQLGLSHLIAISGLHISIIAGLSFWLFYKFLAWSNIVARRQVFEPLRIALIASCIIALLYSALADFSIPTIRALIMWCSVVLLSLLKRQGAFLSGLKLALLLVLLMDPLSILSPSFWMSFIAVSVISLVVLGRLGKKPSWSNLVTQLFKVQIAITLTLVLPSLLLFDQASFAGILVNLVMIPLFSLLLLPGIILAVLMHSVLGLPWLLQQIDLAIEAFFSSIHHIKNWLDITTIDWTLPVWLLVTLLVINGLVLLPLGRIRLPFVAIAVVFISSMYIPDKTANQPQMIVFDVGHGLAVLLTDGKHHILYDTGYASAGGTAFESFILPSLKMLGIEHLDLLILSHKDNDHAGGASQIIKQIAVNKVMAGQWAQRRMEASKHISCKKGQQQTIGSFRLKVLHPENDKKGDNNDSCVIKVIADNSSDFGQNKALSVLLTGDIEKAAELQLAETLTHALKADILLAPHHGSNSSSTYPFIKRVDPQVTIYSTERYSRYRLPHQKVIKRYHDFGIKQLHTGCLGQLTFNLIEHSYQFERSNQFIWRKSHCDVGKVSAELVEK